MLFDCFDSKRKLLGPLKLRGKCIPFSFSVRLSLNWCIHLCLLHSLPCFRVFGSRPSNRTNFRRNDLCWPFGKKVVYLQAELLLQPQRNTKNRLVPHNRRLRDGLLINRRGFSVRNATRQGEWRFSEKEPPNDAVENNQADVKIRHAT